MSQSHVISPIGPDGIVRCYTHNLEAALLTSNTAANPGRKFYCCAKEPRSDRCKFWYWADDPILQLSAQPPVQPAVPTPPRPSQRQRAQHLRSPSSSQEQRGPSPSPPPLTPSQKRLEDIKMALSQAEPQPSLKPSAIGLSPKEKRLADIQSGLSLQNSPVTPKTRPRPDDTEEDSVSTFSQASQTSKAGVGPPSQYSLPDVPPEFRSPKRLRLLEPVENDGESNGMLLTPPRSSLRRHEGNAGQGGLVPETPTRSKGKEKEVTASASQWQQIQDDPDNPFHERRASLRAQMQPGHISNGHAADLSYGQMELTADSISNALEHLNDVPDLIRKLERKRLAAEKSSDAKAKKIAELEDEIVSLEIRVRVLEETNRALNARR